ncbi:MAG: phosphate signaling complex protein PhoU [Candidatus Metalachnospira sp.]|nr:phosphate signaling complex protein PhoU [Candidatus Metalachnospira sp.]
MRNKFDQQLELLHVELIRMGALCEDAVTASITALEKNDLSLLKKVFETESEIDEKERDIERMCMMLLLQQQPVATDLRVISSALKMITDMERVGDQAADIAEISRFIIGNGEVVNDDMKKMAKEAIKMVTDSVDSFVKKDLELARKVIAYDDVVDNWFTTLKKEIIEMIAKDSLRGEYYIDILMIAKYLERIGDHATNIAEWVEFSITGVRSKNN